MLSSTIKKQALAGIVLSGLCVAQIHATETTLQKTLKATATCATTGLVLATIASLSYEGKHQMILAMKDSMPLWAPGIGAALATAASCSESVQKGVFQGGLWSMGISAIVGVPALFFSVAKNTRLTDLKLNIK